MEAGSLDFVLAPEGKTPLREAASPAPGRTTKSQQRSQVARKRAVIAGVVVLALVGGGALLASRDGGGGIIPNIIGPDEPKPEFNFTVSKVFPKTTTATKPKELAARIEPIGEQVAAALDSLYLATFIDPGVWEDGDYADAFGDVMEEAAVADAEAGVDALTLGTDAGATYESVEPLKSTLAISVLTGTEDQPLQAIGRVWFIGLAEHDDGSFTKVISTGTYLFHKVDGEWKILSFDVDRDEKKAKAPASPSASATATPSGEVSP